MFRNGNVQKCGEGNGRMEDIKESKKENKCIFCKTVSKEFSISKIKIIGLEDELIKKILN